MKKVVYFDVEEYEKKFLIEQNEGKYNYRLVETPLNDVIDADRELTDAEIISVFTTSRVKKEVLSKFKNLKLIALRSVGFNHIDLDYCSENGIVIENTPNYGNKSVAEFAVGLMLDVCRKITKSNLAYKEMMINPIHLSGNELGGKTVGIVGLGAIGSEFARLVHGLDMKIIGYDIKENDMLKEQYGVVYTDFDTLLGKSDFISLHSPLTKENYHLFNADALKKMKKSAILINTARGELIDTQALYNALMQKEIKGVGLDVLESEETVSDPDYLVDINRLNKGVLKQTILNTRLMQLDNVIITPHIAYNTEEAIMRILETTMLNINSYANGHILNSVN